MTTRKIKLGALTMGCGGPGRHNLWLDPELPADVSVNIDWHIDIARQAEAALFDLMFIVDSQYITPGSPPHYLNRLEPLTLLSALAVSTRRPGQFRRLTEQVVPLLRERGVYRTAYEGTTLRESLGLAIQ